MSGSPSQSPIPARIGAAVAGGLVAGTIDIGAACLINMRSPVVITHAIASGLLGPASFRDGAASAWLGLVLQWAMAVVIALIYGYAVDLLPGLRQRWIAAGLMAGVVTFVVMNYVVLRLSAVGRFASFTVAGFSENLVAILLFGTIIAYFARGASAAPGTGMRKTPGDGA
jgi:hypothetical protein